jgi:hypothetical protein
MAITITSTGITYSDGTSDSTQFNSQTADKGALISITTFTSNGTYTVPANCSNVYVQLVGGGGGSAGYCESGGGGGFGEGLFSVTAGSTISVTIGGGGGGVTYYNVASTGGTTSFGSYLSATGGYGANQNIQHGGGAGGLGSGGNVNLYGGTGCGHLNHGSHSQTGYGGATYFGGGGGVKRHQNYSHNISQAPGSGACGNECDGDGTVGTTGSSGLCIVYAYK